MVADVPKEKHTKIGSLGRATLILIVFTLVSRLMGLVRYRVLVNSFGVGETLDAFYASFRIPDLLFNLFIMGTLSVAFLPIFNNELIKSRESAEKLASSIFTATILAISALGVVLSLASPLLVSLIAPGFTESQHDLTVGLARLMALTPIFFSVGVVVSVLLHSYNRFFATAIAPIFYNIGIILGATYFYKLFGPIGLAFGVLLGAGLHMLVQLYDLKNIPIKLKFSFDFKTVAAKKVWKMYLPRLLYFDNDQISLLIGSIIGSFLAAGSITVFSMSSDLQAVPLGIFASSFTVAAFPGLAKAWADKNSIYFKKLLSQTTVQILFFVIPLSALMFVLRAQIVRVLFQSDRLTWGDLRLTAQAFGIFSLAIFAKSLVPLLARAFYATYNTATPVMVSIFVNLLNVALAIFMGKEWGVLGLAGAAAITGIINCIMLGILLRLRIGKFFLIGTVDSILKILIASSLATTSAYGTLYAVSPVVDTSTTWGLFIQATCATLMALVVYLIMGLLLNLPEARSFMKTLQNWIFKLTRPITLIASLWEK